MTYRPVTIQYHNSETKEDTRRCPGEPVFLEHVWTSTRIEQTPNGEDFEVHLVTVDYRDFKYA